MTNKWLKFSKFYDATKVIPLVADIFPFSPPCFAEVVKVELILFQSMWLMNE